MPDPEWTPVDDNPPVDTVWTPLAPPPANTWDTINDTQSPAWESSWNTPIGA
jgi:hypothetical protein